MERPTILGDGGISDLGDSAVMFKIVTKVKAGEQWFVSAEAAERYGFPPDHVAAGRLADLMRDLAAHRGA